MLQLTVMRGENTGCTGPLHFIMIIQSASDSSRRYTRT